MEYSRNMFVYILCNQIFVTMWVGGRMVKALVCGWKGESSNFMSMTIHHNRHKIINYWFEKTWGVRAMGLTQPHFEFIHNLIPK